MGHATAARRHPECLAGRAQDSRQGISLDLACHVELRALVEPSAAHLGVVVGISKPFPPHPPTQPVPRLDPSTQPRNASTTTTSYMKPPSTLRGDLNATYDATATTTVSARTPLKLSTDVSCCPAADLKGLRLAVGGFG